MRIPPFGRDLAVVAFAALDVWLDADPDKPVAWLLSGTAVLGLFVRRRFPYASLVLALPGLAASNALIAGLIALYSVAVSARSHGMLALCAFSVGIAYAIPWPLPELARLPNSTLVLDFLYAAIFAGAPTFLGLLVSARADLSLRLTEITAAREQERKLVAETVLAKERARLAREMHDVVSHQVGLIAVQAGAMQVSAPDARIREGARTIRELSVNTLDELRRMVSLLRASGSAPTELTPQPTLKELERLIDGSGIPARLEGDMPAELDVSVQRAIYRTVQEALTNVRKHAPGASAVVRIRRRDGDVCVAVTNTAPTRPAVPLPSAQHGLVGLRERAELLHGTLHTGPTDDGGFQVVLRFPTHSDHSPR